MTDTSAIPSKAVDAEADLVPATTALLRSLSVLGTPGEQKKAGDASSAIGGPPDSVAVIGPYAMNLGAAGG